MMIKKVAILLLWFAQAIILGHNFFAHHHHHTPHSTHSHANGHHHHHSDENDDGGKGSFGHLFSFVQHSGEHLSFTISVSTTISLVKDFSQPVVAASQRHVSTLEYISVCKQHAFPPGQCELYKSLHLLFYDLRGPPTFIVS